MPLTTEQVRIAHPRVLAAIDRLKREQAAALEPVIKLEQLLFLQLWKESPPDTEQLAALTLALRDEEDALEEAYKAAKKTIANRRTLYDVRLLQALKDNGNEPIQTAAGTAYIRKDRFFNVKAADWDTFIEWVIYNNRVDLLGKKVSSTAMEQYMTDYSDLPPGVGMFAEDSAVVRRS